MINISDLFNARSVPANTRNLFPMQYGGFGFQSNPTSQLPLPSSLDNRDYDLLMRNPFVQAHLGMRGMNTTPQNVRNIPLRTLNQIQQQAANTGGSITTGNNNPQSVQRNTLFNLISSLF